MAAMPAWIHAHDDEAIAFEKRAERRLTARLRDLVASAMRELAAEYVQLVGGLELPVPLPAALLLRRTMVRIALALSTGLASEVPALLAGLMRLIGRGVKLGIRQAAALLNGAPAAVAQPSRELVAVVDRLGRILPEQVARAVRFAETMPVRSWAEASVPLAMAGRAVTTAESTTRWVANRAIAEGSSAVAQLAGVGRMWVAERNACLTCLAYSGEVAPAGHPFPAGLTFGKTSSVKEPLWFPPAHPNCRCRVKPHLGPGGGVDISTALKREAQRSVLRGDSAHDSRPARLRAAERLLDAGLVGTSETAKKRARRAIAAGAFADRGKPKTSRPRRPGSVARQIGSR